ncbi:unnamed protein product [Anisakis simplex]|uniref:BPI2 domain-containing protein n=1 Tax=Anisakis simplex TaxID=6269 RepID=A0A0M3KD14_ANISI|nr:unnamed protein product [Anisakis simplex]
MPIGKHKRKRAYSEQNVTLLAAASSISQKPPVPTAVPVTISTESQHGSTFNIEKLSPLMLSLSVLDTSATYDKFFIGVNGDVFLNEHTPVKNPYIRPESLKFVTPSKGKSLELLLSEYTINTLLLNAHNVGATVLRVGSQTPVFGKLLRTTCTLDEVCLSDSIPEAGEKYPDRQLEIIIRTTKAPNVRLIADTAMITVEGRSLFYLEGTTQKIGTIPFETTISFNLRTQRNKIHGSVSVVSIEFHKDVDFFEVPVDSLSGLRDATKGAFENMFNKKLNNGTKIEMNDVSSIRNPSVAIVNKALLIQTDYDLRKHFNMNPLRNHNLS